MLLPGSQLRHSLSNGSHISQRRHLPLVRRKSTEARKRQRRPVFDAQLRNVRLLRSIRLQGIYNPPSQSTTSQTSTLSGWSAGKVWSEWLFINSHTQRHGNLPLLPAFGRPRQQLQGRAVLRGAGQEVQLPPLRQPETRLQQKGSETAQVRDEGSEHR